MKRPSPLRGEGGARREAMGGLGGTQQRGTAWRPLTSALSPEGRGSSAAYWSRNDRILRLRLGCFSFLSAFASIWRMRSRVTENC